MTDYFDDRAVNRQRLLWAIATRRQLERWELFVRKSVLAGMQNRHLDGMDIWLAAMEHHFALIAARNLLRALELASTSVAVNPTVRAELIEGRDLNEHWAENMPVFNVRPRAAQPQYRSGKDFAARNPDRRPYVWLGFSNKTGARLLPHVFAPALHKLVDAVETEVIDKDDALRRFVPPRALAVDSG